jgi:Na+-transporting methylmalonyl-CoA/oxaloacetate decarboxylase gamma subunit
MGYLDPGLFGILSQVGLAVFLVVVSIFAFFMRPIKKVVRKILGRPDPEQAEAVSDDADVNHPA